jgi:DNA-binding transcriptional LysR family regulator
MHQIRYFVAAAGSLSFTRAAEICHVSQPALTMAIKKLEAQLGSPLFLRDGRQLTLTDFGRRMQPALTQILDQAKLAEGVAKEFRLLDQVPIRFGVMSTIGPGRISELMAEFERLAPGVDISVTDGAPEALAAQLDADEIDLAILNPLDGLGEKYRTEPLYTERYMVVLPSDSPLKESETLALRDLSNQPYVDRLLCEMRDMVMEVCKDMGIHLYARFRSQREDWVQAMVLANIGFAFMPEYSITNRESICRPLVDPVVERTICLLTVPGRQHSPAVARFLDVVRGQRWR